MARRLGEDVFELVDVEPDAVGVARVEGGAVERDGAHGAGAHLAPALDRAGTIDPGRLPRGALAASAIRSSKASALTHTP